MSASTQIQIWLRPVLMTWMISSTWMMSGSRYSSMPRILRGLGECRRSDRRQRKGHDVIAAPRAERPVAAGTDDEILTLATPGPVGHGRRLAGHRQLILPQLAAGIDVEGAQVAVHGGRHEHQVSRGGDRAAHVRHAELAWRDEPGLEARVRPER